MQETDTQAEQASQPTKRTYRIVSLWADKVLYECDIPDDVLSGMEARHALEKATEAKANLSGADLSGANLSGANLSGAYLSGANLIGADLSGANLSGANLRGANLSGANLSGANLSGANLSGANLSGANLSCANLSGAYLSCANLSGDLKLVGARPLLMIGPIGSMQRTLNVWITSAGLRIQTGCFFGSREEFVKAVAKTHGDANHGTEYRAALALIDAHAALWTPAATTEGSAQ